MRKVAWAALVVGLAGFEAARADDVTVVTQENEAAAGLDLTAVGQLVQEVGNAEELERKLNNPDLGINNLDLNQDGDVDYVRVVSKDSGDTHVMILQAPLGENDFQDIATLQIDRDDKGEVALQIQGDPVIYGPDYYVVPTGVRVSLFPFVTWVYSPLYRPWVSTVYWGVYPRSWHPWRVVPYTVYRPRVVGYTHVSFSFTNRSAVVRAGAVYSAPVASVRVTRPTRASMKDHAVAAHVGPEGQKTVLAHGTDAQGDKKTVLAHTNPETGTKTAIGVEKQADGDKTIHAKQVKETEEGTKSTHIKQTNDKKDDGTTTTTRTKTKKTESGTKTKKTKKTKKTSPPKN